MLKEDIPLNEHGYFKKDKVITRDNK